ncbi:MAG: sulfotransferase, partial [Planctomycetota bacterium]
MIGPTGENLVLVLGLPRSGTTLLCALLANHPEVVCPAEPWILLALDALGCTAPAHPADARLLAVATRAFLDETDGLAARRAFATTAYNRLLAGGGGRILVDKTPRYYHRLDEIERTFPDARLVWIQRDLLDVAASYASSWDVDVAGFIEHDVGHPAALDLVVGAPRLEAFADARPQRVHRVEYEQLVRDPAGVMAGVLDALGLEAPPEIDLTPRSPGGAAMGDRKIESTDRVHDRSIGTGLESLSTGQLQVLQDALGTDLLRRCSREGTIERLRDRGVVDRGPAVTAARRDDALAALAERWSEVLAPPGVETRSQLTAPLTERAERAEAALRDLAAEHEAMQQRHASEARARDRDQARAAAAEASLARENEWKALSPRRRFRLSLKQVRDVGLELILAGEPDPAALPSISVVTPLVGEVHGLQATVASLARQDHPRIEHVIAGPAATIEDLPPGPDDESHDVRLVPTAPDANRAAALESGLAAATGDVLTWIDPGDELAPGALRRVARELYRRPRVQALYLEGTVRVGPWQFPESAVRGDLFAALDGQSLPLGGVFVRRWPFRSIGGLETGRPLAAEDAIWLALTR